MDSRQLAAALALFVSGCGPAVPTGDGSGSSGASAESSTGPADPSTTSTTTQPPPSPTTTSPVPPPPPETTSGSSSSSGEGPPPDDPCGCPFLCPGCPPKGCPGYDPECGIPFECDLWAQDCLDEGTKCMPWADDGSPIWNATRCVPVDPTPNQVGDPCTVEGSGYSGIDSCDVSQMCFDVDPDNNGTCVAFCGGSEADPQCPEGQACFISNDGILILCLPTCDPLLPTCPEGEGCFPAGGEEGFVCLPAPHEGIDSYWTCLATGGCEPDTLCIDGDALPDCDADGCCTPYCDVTDMDPMCPPDTECVPFYEKGAAPPEYANVGVCWIPG